MKNLAYHFGKQFVLVGALCVIILPSAYAAAADNALPADPKGSINKPAKVTSQKKEQPIAFLVNGFSGCCIPKKVKQFLEEKGARIYEANWNDLDRKRDPGSFSKPDQITYNTDEYFIKQMQDIVKDIPETTPLIIIGHSFGGDSVLQVAKRIRPRRIAFLAVLDPVGRGALRENVTRPVTPNVDYFFNRWQQNPPLPADVINRNLRTGKKPEKANVVPIDSLQSGEITSQAAKSSQGKQNTEKTSKCKTKYRDPFKLVPQLLSHSELPNDSCIQHKMIEILEARLFN
ncbi:MAG TPA: alpha/beta hydrolase [Candidatus Binatia bacterium]|jgi:hypothetical protein|nr:alpha/beta hydrolase [Candidatus Binatia bacterium]